MTTTAEDVDADVVTDHPDPIYQPVRAADVTREAHIQWA